MYCIMLVSTQAAAFLAQLPHAACCSMLLQLLTCLSSWLSLLVGMATVVSSLLRTRMGSCPVPFR